MTKTQEQANTDIFRAFLVTAPFGWFPFFYVRPE